LKRNLALLFLSLLLLPTVVAGPIYSLETSAVFSGGVGGSWIFNFTSGPADLYLQQLTITLPTNVRFDTASGGFGYGASQGIGAAYLGTDTSTGLYQVTPDNNTLDGGQTVTFYFNGFTAGETFYFAADIDAVPNLVALRNCNGLGPIAKGFCEAQNATTERLVNDPLRAAASFVVPSQFAGATASYVFGGPTFNTAQFTNTFSAAGGLLILGAATSSVDEVTENPEPGAWALLAGGLGLMGFRFRRRR
jgi:hypothetical protein